MTRIVLTSPDPAQLAAWETHCGALGDVEIRKGSVFDQPCDALVSPANSFGFMDGGIDAQYTHRFGARVQDAVRMAILQRHHGELLVGQAVIVETGAPDFPYLAAAPTMRVPMVLPAGSINAYLATRAVLLAIREGQSPDGRPAHEAIKTVCFPGMGTGVGRMPPGVCARQMAAAIQSARAPRHRLPGSWAEASENHQLLYTDKPQRLQ